MEKQQQQQHLLPRSRSARKAAMGLRNLVKACWSPSISDCECYGDKEVLAAAVVVVDHEQQQQQQQKQKLRDSITNLPDDLLVECLARIPRESLQDSLMVCRKWRCIVKSDIFYHTRQKLRRVESLIVVFGGAGAGLSSTTYSHSTGEWKSGELSAAITDDHHRREDCKKSRSSSNLFLQAQPAVVKQRIFVLGASSGSMVYDTWNRSLRRAAPMLFPRKKFACCVISNRILVAGGASSSGAVMREAEEYIPELDVWRPIASMPRRRYGCIGAAVGGIFYVIGGLKRPCAYVGSMDCFDATANVWLKSKPLPKGGGCVIACTVVGCCIYMLWSHAVELSFWRYDAGTGSGVWSRINLPPVPSPLRIDNVLRFSCVTLGSAVHIIQLGGCVDDLLQRGGRNPRGIREGLVLVYDTLLNEWSRKTPYLPNVRNGALCAVVDS